MALVEGHDAAGTVAPREDDGTQVRQTHVQVRVLFLQIGHDCMIACVQTRNREPPGRQIIKKGKPRRAAETLTKQVVDLCRYRGGNHQLTGFVTQQSFDPWAERIAPVRHRHQWCGIEHQGHSPNPAKS